MPSDKETIEYFNNGWCSLILNVKNDHRAGKETIDWTATGNIDPKKNQSSADRSKGVGLKLASSICWDDNCRNRSSIAEFDSVGQTTDYFGKKNLWQFSDGLSDTEPKVT